MDAIQLIDGWSLELSPDKKAELKKSLAHRLNELLLHDFESLVQLLYRADVSEQKLKTVLAENSTTDACELIADLLIKRQEEKLASRQAFPPASGIPDDERW